MMGLDKAIVGRRKFLFILGTGAGVATGVKLAASSAPITDPDTQHRPENLDPRYRETNHIRTFYQVSRYEGGRSC